MGEVAIMGNEQCVFLLLVAVKTGILEGHSISVKSLSLIVIDGSEPKRLKFSDRYLEI